MTLSMVETLIKLFWAFFVANILGYGGGPPIIPLLQEQIVDKFKWMDLARFGDVFALGNALPSPIATKLAGYIGYEVAGVSGAAVALAATVVPTAIAMILLYKFKDKFKHSPQVMAMTQAVRPVVAVLLGILAWQFFANAWQSAGMLQTAEIAAVSLVALEKFKVHPAVVVGLALAYGALVLN